MAVPIHHVEPDSPADRAGLQAGMALLSLDGHAIRDGLDYEFFSACSPLEVVFQDKNKQTHTTIINKEEYEPLGCGFESYLIDKQRHCKNNCLFCFIDQLPKGMRSSLYFKDDDERLSFLFGNYITLTNLTRREIDRIIEMRFAPVNISVHTADPALRVRMMRNPLAGEVLQFIPRLAAADIPMNCQLVLCPGVNDGAELQKTIEWLASFYPAVQSIAAVPVGLTCHRADLYSLDHYTKETAAVQLRIMLEYGDEFKKEYGVRLVYPSDEWFLLAGQAMPPEEFYDGYLQLENGVGMWRLFYDQFVNALDDLDKQRENHAVDIVTGASASGLLRALQEALQQRQPNLTVHVHEIQNQFFGAQVGVSGLLTGQDIIAQLRGKLKTNTLLLPSNVLRSQGDVLLDGVSPEEIAKALDTRVQIVEPDGAALIEAIIERI